jgi:predicted RNA binding protein YcfA (HicA-like mRNA interferase family)
MVKRRDVVKELTKAGFVSRGGKKHEKFTDGTRITEVPRHAEVDDYTYRSIRRQAGLD